MHLQDRLLGQSVLGPPDSPTLSHSHSLRSLALGAALDCRPWPSALSLLSLLFSGSGSLSSNPAEPLLACCHLGPTTLSLSPLHQPVPSPWKRPFWSLILELIRLLGASKLLHIHMHTRTHRCTRTHTHPPSSQFLVQDEGGGLFQGARGEGQWLNFESLRSLK